MYYVKYNPVFLPIQHRRDYIKLKQRWINCTVNVLTFSIKEFEKAANEWNVAKRGIINAIGLYFIAAANTETIEVVVGGRRDMI